MALWASGIGVSRGIAIGRVQRLNTGDLDIPDYALAPEDIEREVARYAAARSAAREDLERVRSRIPQGAPSEIAAFIDTHLLMLEDRSLGEAVIAKIREQRRNAESALLHQRDALVEAFEAIEDAYLRARQDDVRQISDRVLRNLLNAERHATRPESSGESLIVVADDITPADIILLHQQGVTGFITEYGGPLSHTAILARSLGIPAIVGLHRARRLFRDGELIVVDGDSGHALADPDSDAQHFFENIQRRQAADRAALSSLRETPAVSGDGVKIRLLANIELPADAAEAAKLGVEGVGLYRTEFLFMNRQDLPSEDEQYEAYAAVVASTRGEITVRTLDLGADKQVDSGRTLSPTPNNPALGLRAIRLCLKEPSLFRTQLRALLRAAKHGQMKIMLPMISNVTEFRQALSMIRAASQELDREGQPVPYEVPVGAMIEVPAAALAAPWLAQYASFFSIGTNDLIQYTLAIDRVDDEVNYLYDPLHPAVLRLIRMTIESGARAGIPVAMCGEMAGDPRYTGLLLGLGLTEFSMHPASVLEIKRIIIESDIGKLRAATTAILHAPDVTEMRRRLEAVHLFGNLKRTT